MSAPSSPVIPSPMGSYPKSCLKRNSVASVSASDSGSDDTTSSGGGSPGTSPRDASPCFRRNSPAPAPSNSTPTPTKRSSSARPPLSPVGSDDDANTRRKSVSFCDDHDVRIIYPDPPRPALKQARRAASRLFRACAGALRIDSSDAGRGDDLDPDAEYQAPLARVPSRSSAEQSVTS